MTLEDLDREMFNIVKNALSFLELDDQTYQKIYHSYHTLIFSDYRSLENALTGIINLEEEFQDSAHWMVDAYFPQLADDDRFIYEEFNDFVSEEILKLAKIYK
ncbi:MAG: hypothetical protein VX154_05845 [Pseudomonadota bacterium]|nr:hypothetical protein [Pseudomonadota bacterium]